MNRRVRWLAGALLGMLVVSACSPAEEAATTTAAPAPIVTTTTEPPLDLAAYAQEVVVSIESEGDFLQVDSPSTIPIGEGSGVVIAEDGLILTTATSVVGSDRINVFIPGEEFPVVGVLDAAAECANLALVRVDYEFAAAAPIDGEALPAVLATGDREGATVAAIAPEDLNGPYALSGVRGVPSGSALIDQQGNLAGIVTGYTDTGEARVLPAADSSPIVTQMRQRDIVEQLGFAPIENTEGQVVVAAVSELGSGWGLGKGDSLISAEGEPLVGGVESLCAALDDGTAEIEVVKDGRRHVGIFPDGSLVLASSRTTEEIREAVVEVRNEFFARGSGFFIDATGLLVTNYHVVGGNDEMFIRFDDREETVPARVVAGSACVDIALLQAEGGPYEYLEWSPDAPALQDEVKVVGFPNFTETISFQDGRVAKERAESPRWGGFVTNFTSSATTDGGNSGGPVVNASGEILGVHYASRSGNDERVKESLHLVGTEVREVVDGLVAGNVVDPLFAAGNLVWGYDFGVFSEVRTVEDVFVRGPAHDLGLRDGDLLIEFGESGPFEIADRFSHICDQVEAAGPDGEMGVVIYRPVDGSYYDGVWNGTPLAPRPAPIRYSSVDGSISLTAPGNWDQYREITPADGNDWIGFWAAPDLDGPAGYFNDFGEAYGLRVLWSSQRAETHTTESYFEGVSYKDRNTGPPEPFRTDRFEGHVQRFNWTSIDNASNQDVSVEYAFTLRDVEDSPMILLYLNVPPYTVDYEGAEILESLELSLPEN